MKPGRYFILGVDPLSRPFRGKLVRETLASFQNARWGRGGAPLLPRRAAAAGREKRAGAASAAALPGRARDPSPEAGLFSPGPDEQRQPAGMAGDCRSRRSCPPAAFSFGRSAEIFRVPAAPGRRYLQQ